VTEADRRKRKYSENLSAWSSLQREEAWARANVPLYPAQLDARFLGTTRAPAPLNAGASYRRRLN